MAKLEQVISGDFYEVLGKIERGIVEQQYVSLIGRVQ